MTHFKFVVNKNEYSGMHLNEIYHKPPPRLRGGLGVGFLYLTQPRTAINELVNKHKTLIYQYS